jgi:hypothetical protein
MQRIIKFRARNAELPCGWIYGYFAIRNGSCRIINDDGEHRVIAGTESQFIERHDKNGKEIYEGDIGVYDGDVDNPECRYAVRWDDALCGFSLGDDVPLSDPMHFIILGNLFENPELLEP